MSNTFLELIFSTYDFKLRGIAYPGFPILITKESDIFTEALDFMIFHCIQRGKVQSESSWETFGRDLYDYFGFLECNDIHWADIRSRYHENILALYRDDALKNHGISPNTVNRRLHLIIKFYQYAYRTGSVSSVPYEMEEVRVKKTSHFLVHTDTSGGVVTRPNVLAKTKRTQTKVLSTSQIQELLKSINNRSLYLMVRLGLSTGLRKSELLTFPAEYIINPARSSAKGLIPVYLNPLQMKIKGDHPRTIHVPVSVMSELWEYLAFYREQLIAATNNEPETLFVNRYGESYSEAGRTFNNELKALNTTFNVTPHMLRHSYATHTLKALNSMPSLPFNALMYVRDRLGHSSISTTEKYLGFISDLDDSLRTIYQDEIDAISEELLESNNSA